MFFALRLLRKVHLCRSSSNVPRWPNWCKTVAFCSLLARCRIPCACPTKAHPNFKKCSENGVLCSFDFEVCFVPQLCTFFRSLNSQLLRCWCVFNMLNSNCVSRYNGVHFFSNSTSKSGPTIFVHVELDMRFTPHGVQNVHLSSPQIARNPPL